MHRMIRIAIVAFAALLARGALACSSDNDCKGDRICHAGLCVDPSSSQGAPQRTPQTLETGGARPVSPGAVAPAVQGPTPVSPDVQLPSSKAGSKTSIYMNALGVLQFGLAPTIEYGSKLAFNARIQLFNTGALPYLIAGAGDDTLNFSWGAGPGLRYYYGQNGNLRGGYLGGQALIVSWSEQWEDKILYKTGAVALLAEGGYRWVYPNDFTLGVGIAAGPAPILDASTEAMNGYTLYPGDYNDASTMFIGFFTVDVGFML